MKENHNTPGSTATNKAAATSYTPAANDTAVGGDLRRAKKDKANYAVQSILHAFDVLEELGRSPGPVGVSDLSRRLRLHKNTIFRLLASLTTKGYAVQDGDNYKISPKVVHLAQGYLCQSSLIERARPVLKALAEKSGETVSLGLLEGLNIQFPISIESKRSVRVSPRSGMSLSAKFSAAGRLLLAQKPDSELLEILATNSPQDAAIKNQLHELRSAGLIVDKGAIEADVVSISKIVLSHTGETLAAVELLVPQYRGRIDGLTALVEEVAVEISGLMGHNREASATLSGAIERTTVGDQRPSSS